MHFPPAMSQGTFLVHTERSDFLGVEMPHYRYRQEGVLVVCVCWGRNVLEQDEQSTCSPLHFMSFLVLPNAVLTILSLLKLPKHQGIYK